MRHETDVEYVKTGLKKYDVPDHLHEGLIRYLTLGIQPGHFLTAVLENDLAEAVARGDETSRAALSNIVRFLYYHAPLSAWGSPQRVYEWMHGKKDEIDTEWGAMDNAIRTWQSRKEE